MQELNNVGSWHSFKVSIVLVKVLHFISASSHKTNYQLNLFEWIIIESLKIILILNQYNNKYCVLSKLNNRI